MAFLAAALFCFMKKRRKRVIKKTDDITFDERMRIHETAVPGPHGEQAVLVTLEEDIHAHETKTKDEIVGGTSHSWTAHHPQSHELAAPNFGSHHSPN